MADQRFRGAVQIVDFYHACGHLSELCGAACPDTDGERFRKLFRTRRDMLRKWGVDAFRKKGYFIGSGVIEGSCKCLVNQRCDLAGQRWHPGSSQKVLWIRAAVQDGLHDSYWRERSTFKAAARTAA